MKKAVMYGAGNIGRGFIGQLLSQSGYEVVFIDVNARVVDKLNEDRCYPIKFVSDKGSHEVIIQNVRAVNGTDAGSIAEEISTADIMATAVGASILPKIAAPVANALKKRWSGGNVKPLNIIICENLIDCSRYFKGIIEKQLCDHEKALLNNLTGFVEASIGRMVPAAAPEAQQGNLLRVCAEEYGQLPVDREGFIGEIPGIKNMIPFSPFQYYIHRKLFIHNMGHAVTAYLGYQKGCRYIWEAAGDEEIRKTVRAAMLESAEALSREHGAELEKIREHVEDLIARFGNRQLGDTVERVGRDLQRKLSPNDRLIGALNICIKNNINPVNICAGIAAALHFKDPSGGEIPEMLSQGDREGVLGRICGIERGTREWKLILA